MATHVELLQEIKNLRAELAKRTADLETLTQQTADLAFLNALNAAANRGDPLDKIIALIAERTSELFNSYGATIALVDETGTRLNIKNLVIPKELLHRIETILGSPIPKLSISLTSDSQFTQAIAQKKTILFTGEAILKMEREYALSNAPHISEKLLNRILQLVNSVMNLKSVMIAPLVNEGRVVGTLDLASNYIFTPHDINRFDALAAQLTGIIARKQANAALQRSEALYHSLVENIPQNIFRKDKTGRFTFVNNNYCQMVGKPAEEILGKTDFDLHPKEQAQKYRRDDNFVMTSGKTLDIIEKHKVHSGATHYVRVVKTPLFDGKSVIGIQGIFEDITLQKENEDRLKQYSKRLNLLHEIDRAILTAVSPVEIATAVLKPLLRLIPARRISVVELSEATNTGRILATAGDIHPVGLQTGTVFSLEHYPVYRQYQNSPDNITQTYLALSESPIEQKLKNESIAAALNVMLIFNNELIGALNFGFAHAEDILPEYREIAREVGDSLAVALKQAQQTEKIQEESAAKTRLLQEIDHRVRNNLAAIAGMIYLEIRQAETTHTPISQKTLEAINVRVRSLAALHELLATHTWNPLPLRDVASRIFNAVCRAINTNDNEILVDIATTNIMVPPQTAHHLTMLFAEIIFSIVEYALQKYNRLVVRVSFEEGETQVTLTFCVEGVVFPKTLLDNPPDSAGMTLLNAAVKQSLHGEWHMANKNGSGVITIRFPRQMIVSASTL